MLTQPARHYAVTAPLDTPIDLSDDRPLIVQYEVRMQDGLSCGGAYLKLYADTPGFSPSSVTGSSPYVVMFGPDRCGSTDKVHFIARYPHPTTGEFEEKHLAQAPRTAQDTLSHLYTLILRPDATFSVRVDGAPLRSGNLSEDFHPAFVPPAEIDDPEDSKPADWVDEARITDVTASKPADWDENAPMMVPDEAAGMPTGWLEAEPAMVPEPGVSKPADWDDEEDGEWEAPQVPNPKCDLSPGCGPWTRPLKRNPAYKGPWRAPLIDNPAYKGPWAPRRIPNPAAYTDDRLHRIGGGRIAAVGIEVWTMSGGLLFDNILVARDEASAEEFAAGTFFPKAKAEAAAADAKQRASDRVARLAAAQKGTWVDVLVFWAGEAADFASSVVPDPRAAVAIGVVGLGLFFLTLYALCAKGDSGLVHGHYHRAGGSHAHSHGHEDENGAADAGEASESDAGPKLAPPAAEAKPAPEAAAQDDEDDGAAPASASGKGGVRRRAKRA